MVTIIRKECLKEQHMCSSGNIRVCALMRCKVIGLVDVEVQEIPNPHSVAHQQVSVMVLHHLADSQCCNKISHLRYRSVLKLVDAWGPGRQIDVVLTFADLSSCSSPRKTRK